jgi:predicted DNA-binding transcriptional regulator YafY
VGFDYRGKARRLRPYGLVHRRGHWYLVGGPSGEEQVRSFRVDRITSLRIGRRPGAFTRPAGLHAADFVPEVPWEAGEEGTLVEVRFDPAIAWWARRQLGEAEIEEEPGGCLRARLTVANVEAFLGWMVGFEDGAEILAPPAVRAAFLAHVGAGP